jgi:hypothetical protein
MTQYFEDTNPEVRIAGGFNTAKPVTMESTLAVTGVITATGGVAGAVSATTLNASGLVKVTNPVIQATSTLIDAQSGTPSIAQLLGGVIKHNSKTGAGTITVPTGALISAGIPGVAVGSVFETLYHNYGNQTATITTAASGTTLIGGTAAVTTGKHIKLTFVCTAADTWDIYLTTLF